MDKFILLSAAILFLCSICLFIYDRITLKKSMDGLSKMLDRAISGNFDQFIFDETMYSRPSCPNFLPKAHFPQTK